jgi:hypothetical protein
MTHRHGAAIARHPFGERPRGFELLDARGEGLHQGGAVERDGDGGVQDAPFRALRDTPGAAAAGPYGGMAVAGSERQPASAEQATSP